jgi:uncharacterized protein with HEPN domain
MVNRDYVRLLHIRDAIVRIERYAAVGHERFSQETVSQDAIIRQLELVCEATTRLSADLRNGHPELASGRLGELQEEFDTNYLDIDLRLVWNVTQQTLPELKRTVESILDEQERA